MMRIVCSIIIVVVTGIADNMSIKEHHRRYHSNNLTSGNSFANDTATNIPSKKKFLDTKALIFSSEDDISSSSPPPPRTVSPRILIQFFDMSLSP